MRKITGLFLGVLAVAGMANCGSAMAQSSDAGTKFYRLDFEVKEIDLGKVVSSRAYSTMVSTEAGHGRDGGSIRAGTRIPININSPDSKEPNIQYMDVGVNIDCSAVRMTNGQITMAVTAEVSTLAVEPFREGPGMVAGNQPMTAPAPSRERGTTSQKDGPMPPPPPQAGDGEQPLRTPPPGSADEYDDGVNAGSCHSAEQVDGGSNGYAGQADYALCVGRHCDQAEDGSGHNCDRNSVTETTADDGEPVFRVPRRVFPRTF